MRDSNLIKKVQSTVTEIRKIKLITTKATIDHYLKQNRGFGYALRNITGDISGLSR